MWHKEDWGQFYTKGFTQASQRVVIWYEILGMHETDRPTKEGMLSRERTEQVRASGTSAWLGKEMP